MIDGKKWNEEYKLMSKNKSDQANKRNFLFSQKITWFQFYEATVQDTDSKERFSDSSYSSAKQWKTEWIAFHKVQECTVGWLVDWVLSSRTEEGNIYKQQGLCIWAHTYFKRPG